MHHPAIALTKNLMWTRSGVVWAMWRLQPAKIGGRQVIYPYASFKEQLAVKGFHQAFYQQLRGEALLLGLTAEIDPVEIVQRMIDGIDLERATEWKEEAELTLDALEQIPLGTRAFWLAVPLAAEGIWDLAQLSLFAAEAKGRNTFALPRRLPPSPMVDRALEAARQIEKRIPAAFNPTPSSPA